MAVWSRLVRFRYLTLSAAGVAGVVLTGHSRNGDWLLLGESGRQILGSHALHVFTDHPVLQVGPLSLPVFGLLDKTSNPQTVACVVAAALVLMLLRFSELAAISVGGNADRVRQLILVGGVAVMFAAADAVGVWGHLEDVAALTCVAAGAWLLARSSSLPAALMLGVAVEFKPWAVLTLPLLLAIPTRKARLAAFVVAISVAIAGWLPFLIGNSATLHVVTAYQPRARHDSLMNMLGYHDGEKVPHVWRSLEILLGLAAGIVAARRSVWLVPFVGLAIRVGIDSGVFSYYAFAVIGSALLADVTAARRLPALTLTTAGCLYVLPSPAGRVVLLFVVAWLLASTTAASARDPGPGQVCAAAVRTGHRT